MAFWPRSWLVLAVPPLSMIEQQLVSKRQAPQLQPPKKRLKETDAGLVPLEQICATHRLMTAVVAAWIASNKTLSLNGLTRAVSSDDLKRYACLAKKYVAGMNAQEGDTGISAMDTVADFASGRRTGT